MLGIAITTHNRPHCLDLSLKHIRMFYRISQKIVVVDDCSDTIIENKQIIKKYRDSGMTIYYHYNEHRLGIANSKNIGIQKLFSSPSVDYFFLLDDDVLIIKNNYWKPFIRAYEKTGNHHFQLLVNGSLNGNLKKQSQKNGVDVYNTGSGCLLFFTKHAIDKIHGFNPNYGLYGHEHIGISCRVNKKGLTPYGIFLVPSDAGKHFHSMDLQGVPNQYKNLFTFASSMTIKQRELAMNDLKSKQAFAEDLK